jgi:hypothetical protein
MAARIRVARWAAVPTALLFACAEATPASDASGADAVVTDTASLDAAVLDAPMIDGGACGYVASLDHSCALDADCADGIHIATCCSEVYIGFRGTELAIYQADELACATGHPVCNCNGGRTTDSGEDVGPTTTVNVGCIARGAAHVCLTYVTMRPVDQP